jgi:hypothetical protein
VYIWLLKFSSFNSGVTEENEDKRKIGTVVNLREKKITQEKKAIRFRAMPTIKNRKLEIEKKIKQTPEL